MRGWNKASSSYRVNRLLPPVRATAAKTTYTRLDVGAPREISKGALLGGYRLKILWRRSAIVAPWGARIRPSCSGALDFCCPLSWACLDDGEPASVEDEHAKGAE